MLKRLDGGLYTYPKVSRLLGELSPDPEEVSQALARRDAAQLIPTGAVAANLLGLSEQVTEPRGLFDEWSLTSELP